MKKLLSVIITSAVLLTLLAIAAVPAGSADAGLILGDADLSGDVSIMDATRIQRHLAGYDTLSGDALLTADADGDNNISIMDATAIQRFMAGYDTDGPVGKPIAAEAPTGSIVLSDSGATVNGDGAYAVGNTVIITEGGDWTVTGSCSDGMIYVDTGSQTDSGDQVRLRLNSMSLRHADGPAIYFENCQNAYLTLTDGTQNTLTDGTYYLKTAEERTVGGKTYSILASNANAPLHSSVPLLIDGAGSLQVNGNYKHGIAGNSSVAVSNGTIGVTSAKDSIHTSGDITVDGANVSLTINSQSDGLDSAGAVTVTHIKSMTIDAEGKGIKAAGMISLSGGAYTVDTTDDCINSSGAVTINGGSYALTTGDDAIHADTVLTVESGAITITGCTEGLEARQVTVNGGVVSVKSKNDGINAAGNSLTGAISITFNGGEVYVVASGDAIDSNGPIDFNGGTVVVQGPPASGNFAIDADEAIRFNGGTVVATCSTAAKWQEFIDKSTNAKYNTNIGTVEKDAMVCVTDGSGNVLAALKSQLTTGELGVVFYQSGVTLSNVKFVTGGAYSGTLNSFGFGTGGTVTGGTVSG